LEVLVHKGINIIATLVMGLALAAVQINCGSTGANASDTQTPPVVTLQPASVTVVQPATATFTVAATGGSLAYQWKVGGVSIPGATGTSYTTAATNVTESGNSYTVEVSNKAAAAMSNAAILTVQPPLAAPTITGQPMATTVTAPGTATFTVVAVGNPAPQYQWQLGGVDIPGATSATYTTGATSLALNGGSYSCNVSNSLGNTPSAAAVLTVMAWNQTQVYVNGNWDDWATGATHTAGVMTKMNEDYMWTITLPGVTANGGNGAMVGLDLQFAFDTDNDWGGKWAQSATGAQGATGTAVAGGANNIEYVLPEAGDVTITFNDNTLAYTIVVTYWNQPAMYINGNFNSWATLTTNTQGVMSHVPLQDNMWTVTLPKAEISALTALALQFKFDNDNDWGTLAGDASAAAWTTTATTLSGVASVSLAGSGNIGVTLPSVGNCTITFNDATLAYTISVD
jgi:hypothetical protein